MLVYGKINIERKIQQASDDLVCFYIFIDWTEEEKTELDKMYNMTN